MTTTTSSSRVRRWWTEQEDAILREEANAQLNNGALKDWNRIAKKLPGRTNKDCRKRWSKVCEQVNKGTWSAEEDKRLEAAVLLYGSKWTHVAAAVGTRHSDQCAKRWQHSLDPNLDHGEWTEEDDNRLMAAVATSGRNWTAIGAKKFPTRSATDIKNRYVIIERRRKQSTASAASTTSVEQKPLPTAPPSVASSDHGSPNNSYCSPRTITTCGPSITNATAAFDFNTPSPPEMINDRHSSIASEDDFLRLMDSEPELDSGHFSSLSSADPSKPHTPEHMSTALPTPNSLHNHLDPFAPVQYNSPGTCNMFDINGTPDPLLPTDPFGMPGVADGEPWAFSGPCAPHDAEDAVMLDGSGMPPTMPGSMWAMPSQGGTIPQPAPNAASQEWIIGGDDGDISSANVKLGGGSKTVLVLEGVEMDTVNGVIATLLSNRKRVKMRLFTQ